MPSFYSSRIRRRIDREVVFVSIFDKHIVFWAEAHAEFAKRFFVTLDDVTSVFGAMVTSFVVTVSAIRQLSPTGATLMGRFL